MSTVDIKIKICDKGSWRRPYFDETSTARVPQSPAPVSNLLRRLMVPTITRWFRVTHDINSDPEIWELRELYGDRAGFVWLEILSIANRNKGFLGRDSTQLHAVLGSKCRVYSPKVRSILVWCLGKGWLVDRDGLWVAKWLKYNPTRDVDKLPYYTRLDETKQNNKEEEKNKRAQAPVVELPDWIPKVNWDGFVEHRKRIRKSLSVRAMNLTLSELGRLRADGNDPAAVLDQTVANGWTGVFALKNGGFENGHGKSLTEPKGFNSVREFIAKTRQG